MAQSPGPPIAALSSNWVTVNGAEAELPPVHCRGYCGTPCAAMTEPVPGAAFESMTLLMLNVEVGGRTVARKNKVL